jgi:hypothetical protein
VLRRFVTIAGRESFFAWPAQGLAAISESRNQPWREENLCETMEGRGGALASVRRAAAFAGDFVARRPRLSRFMAAPARRPAPDT